MKDNTQKGKNLNLPPGARVRGRPRKDVPLEGVKINATVYAIAQAVCDAQNRGKYQSLVDFSSILVKTHYAAFLRQKPSIPLLSASKNLRSWGKPYKFAYVTYDAYAALAEMAAYLNRQLPPDRLATLPQNVNTSNLLCALVLAELPKYPHLMGAIEGSAEKRVININNK